MLLGITLFFSVSGLSLIMVLCDECLFTEVKRQLVTLILGWVTTSLCLVMSLMALRLTLVDKNPFWPCYLKCLIYKTRICLILRFTEYNLPLVFGNQ